MFVSALYRKFRNQLLQRQSFWIPLAMFSVVLLAVCVSTINYQGDIEEYILMSAAMADHGTPVIRPSDVEFVADQWPVLKPAMDQIAQGMAAHQVVPKLGFYQAQNGQYFAIHFFAYSALVSVPFKLFMIVGIPPLKAFLLVNLLAICVLALSARLFFGDWIRAAVCVLLWMVCGGLNYLYWLGPEILSASFLTSACFLYLRERRIVAGAFVGFAALQNPPIILSLVFLPVLSLLVTYRTDDSFFSNVKRQVSRATILGGVCGACLFAMPIIFNLWAFATPNIIVKVATIPSLMGLTRLHSFYFDLNQGMLMGFAGLWVVLIFAVIRYVREWRLALAFVVSIAFSVVLAIPALSTGNWNSGAIGMMRYALWAGAPFFVLAMVYYERFAFPQPKALLLCFFIQFGLLFLAFSHLGAEFSPISRLVMTYAPSLYNPEPELFIERSVHKDGEVMDPSKVYAFVNQGKITKRIYHDWNTTFASQVCGENKTMPESQNITEAGFGWHYLNGEIACRLRIALTVEQFEDAKLVQFPQGWAGVERATPSWSGRWSNGTVSQIVILLSSDQSSLDLSIGGHYYGHNSRTRVWINGQDYGWQDLKNVPSLSVKSIKDRKLEITLEHEFPEQAGIVEGYPEGRRLAFFLNAIKLF